MQENRGLIARYLACVLQRRCARVLEVVRRVFGPVPLLEVAKDRVGNELAKRRKHTAVAKLRLLASVEPDRIDQMQVPLRAGHRDVEKSPLFIDPGCPLTYPRMK